MVVKIEWQLLKYNACFNLAMMKQITFVTGFAKTVLKGTFCISRNTNLKY